MPELHRSRFTAPVSADLLALAAESLQDAWRADPSVPQEDRTRLDLAVSEVVSNVVRHGGSATVLEMEVVVASDSVAVRIEDDGAPVPAEVPDMPAADAVGGRGLAIATAVVDASACERERGRNVWNLRIDRAPARP
ncbi:ATP-binding protein [Naasia sp. SYSU D00948]|uniref:ATP-binding protein n=1 Tax=Naasia sp. SYSU D00948 TaxID=2817379 RepID=UPI001B308F34|nr:ATP-binding protein [Naasia sp. SYSU D00948]